MHTRFADKYITMGLKIAYYRKKAGLTQELLAEKIGRSVNFIAQVEGTGTVRGVSLETLFSIAEVLGIPASKPLLRTIDHFEKITVEIYNLDGDFYVEKILKYIL